jgi:hypothetical protein
MTMCCQSWQRRTLGETQARIVGYRTDGAIDNRVLLLGTKQKAGLVPWGSGQVPFFV